MSLNSKKFVSLKVDRVSKAYDKKMVLEEVSLEIHSGMILGLLGPNGAGKTTLMKIISDLATPTAGNVTLDGKKLDEIRKEAHLRIGVIPQDNNLERDLTVRDALRCYSWLFGVKNYDQKIDKLAEQFDFVDMLGVNNRNLKTFEQNIQTSFDLAALIPDQFVKVSESGISKIETVRELRAVGYKGFLIGENFMKEENPASALVNFISSLNPA